MDRIEWLLVLVLLSTWALLIVGVVNYHAAVKHRATAAEEARLNRILIAELRHFPRRIPPSMADLTDEELFL